MNKFDKLSNSYLASNYTDHDRLYYMKCFTAGLFPCGLTHTALTPLDVIKCRKQTHYAKYPNLKEGIKITWKEEGIRGLYLGWQPTIIGYALQGSAKYGFYEIFKDLFKNVIRPDYLTLRYMLSSATAEILADCLLCPWESLKVRIQTSPQGQFPNKLIPAFKELQIEGFHGFYKGLFPLILRQVPNTMVKFATFENTVKFIYKNIFTKQKSEYSYLTKLSITYFSGLIAGTVCTFVSNPGDIFVSKLNSTRTSKEIPLLKAIKIIYNEIGFLGLWRGLYIRILIVGSLSGLEWLIYDSFKTMVGLETTGSRHG